VNDALTRAYTGVHYHFQFPITRGSNSSGKNRPSIFCSFRITGTPGAFASLTIDGSGTTDILCLAGNTVDL